MIIGPPGPTGEIVIALSDSGWTTGDGSGVRKIEPLPEAPSRLTLICGGAKAGSLTKCCSLPGCVARMVSTGGTQPAVATVNVQPRGLRPRSRSVTCTRSPAANGLSGRKLAPLLPE